MYNITDTANEAYTYVHTKLTQLHPITYTDTSVILTYEAATVLAALLVMGAVLSIYKVRRTRKTVRDILSNKLVHHRKILADQLMCHFMQTASNLAVKANLKARHKKRMENGSGKPRMPDPAPVMRKFPAPKNHLEVLMRNS